MSEQVSVTNLDRSAHRVAYDLMLRIANFEKTPAPNEAREYFLTLYRQSYKVVYRERSFEEATKPKEVSHASGFRR